MNIYHITTEKGTYDRVLSKAHFQQVRDAHEDYTKVKEAKIWSSYLGEWIEQKAPLRW